MLSLQKKIMFLSAQKFFYQYFDVSSQKDQSNNLLLFFHIHNCNSLQWRQLMSDIDNLNKKRNLKVSFFRIKKEMLYIKHFFSFFKHQEFQDKKYVKSLLNGPCLVVSLENFCDSKGFSLCYKTVKRLEKDNSFVLMGGVWKSEFFHSKEINQLLSVPSLDHIWSGLLQTLLYRSQNFLLLLKHHQNKED